ncbi:MAG: DNA polymerase III subunit [Phycisphaeraceae bacterium]
MDRILGQPQAVDVLQTQLASGRLHHAFIFHGPAGVGKFTTAIALARVLLCHDPVRDLAGRLAACGSCPSCRLMSQASEGAADDAGTATGDEAPGLESADFAAGAHPDLHVVTKELARYHDDKRIRDRKLTQIPVEVLRDTLLEPAYRAAALNHGKVFIVDEAELLNPTGQNLLLKTLEEPPAGTTLVLVTSSEDRLLPTIRSRCQRVAFVPLADEVVVQWLARAAPGMDEPERARVAAVASGSIGRAAMAAAYGLGEWVDVIDRQLADMAAAKPSGTLGGAMAERIDGFAQTWVKRHANASKEAANRLGAEQLFAVLAGYARQRLHGAAGRADGADADELERWVAVIDAVQEARGMLDANVNLALVCDDLALRVAEALGAFATPPQR